MYDLSLLIDRYSILSFRYREHPNLHTGVFVELYFPKMESTTGYTFTTCVGYFTSPDIETNQIEGTYGF